jgi:hypothetical protein
MSTRSVGVAFVLAVATPAVSFAQAASQAQVAERLARAQLDSGKFDASRATFTDMLRVAATRRDSAASIFGRAFAEQQTIELDSVGGDVASRLIQEYRRAASLDAPRYRHAAEVNIALLRSAAGQHDRAAAAYVEAASMIPERQGELLLEGAREFQLAKLRPQAIRVAQQAAAFRDVAADAQALLVELYREGRAMRSIVQLADTLRSATAPLAQVNDALAEMMQDRAWSSSDWGERCLIILARNYAALQVGPVHFSETQRPVLEQAIRANTGTAIGGAMAALLDVYRRRDTTQIYQGHAADLWWKSPSPSDRRRATWSTTLRTLGDWYARAQAPRVAISFYEAALGAPEMPVEQEWVDLDALPPLPALYATLPDTGAYWDRILRIQALTDRLFQSKSAMLPGNERRLRLVRLTLGHLFAQQRRWDNAWYGAIYQLEESRRLGKRMVGENPRETPYFPTDVYELLFAEYIRRGCRAEGSSLGEELRDEYERRGAIADRDRIVAEMGRLQTATPRAGVSCSGALPNT